MGRAVPRQAPADPTVAFLHSDYVSGLWRVVKTSWKERGKEVPQTSQLCLLTDELTLWPCLSMPRTPETTLCYLLIGLHLADTELFDEEGSTLKLNCRMLAGWVSQPEGLSYRFFAPVHRQGGKLPSPTGAWASCMPLWWWHNKVFRRGESPP